ncbi:retrovirus-related pol polyprotein from transposon TNT 1-94, partial [Tanacetum coccineum]
LPTSYPSPPFPFLTHKSFLIPPLLTPSTTYIQIANYLLLTRIGDEIYSSVDACKTAHDMWIAIERLQQGESLNIQDFKTNLFWEFGRFTSRDGETIESYYSRFYKMMNEMIRNNLIVATMQLNVQFLQQLRPGWSRFVTIVKKNHDLDIVSYHKFFEVNEIHAERIAKNANPLALIAKPITPPSKSAFEEDNDPEQAQRVKDMQKNLAPIEKYFKRSTNLPTTTSELLQTPKTIMWILLQGSQVVQQTGIQCFNCKEFGHFAKECRKPKRVKDYTYHKENMLLCKQAKKESGSDAEPLEKDDSNVIPDSSNMCDTDNQADQNAKECDDERVLLTNLIANLKLDTDENKKIQKQLKKANTSLSHELQECKSALKECKSNAHIELQCLYHHKIKECECLAEKLSKQTKTVSKEVYNELLRSFANLENHSISLELTLQQSQEQMKNDKVCKQNRSTVFLKEHEQYFKIQDFKAQLQDKNIAIRVIHNTSVSRPQLKSTQMKENVMQDSSQVKSKKTEVEDHHMSSSISDKQSLTKKPKVVPISTRKPKSQANKSVATPHKKTVASDSTIQKSKSYFRMLYENTNKAWKWWIEKQCPSGYKWTPKTQKKWVPKIRKDNVSTSISPTIDNASRITNIVQLILFIVDSGCTKHMMGNLKLLCNFIEKYLGTVRFRNDQFDPILGYEDLVQGNITIKKVSITTEFAKAVHYQQESDSLPHASCPQGYKDIHLANDILKIKKLSMNEDKTSTTLLIIKSSFKISRYQDKDSREIIRKRFPDDAKYEHVGEDIRSQDGKDDKDLKHKDLNILELKSKSKRKGSR